MTFFNRTAVGYDTEFVPYPLIPISFGLAVADGREPYYAVNSMMPVRAIKQTPFLMEHVWPQLPITANGDLDQKHPSVKRPDVIAHEIRQYLAAVPNWMLVTNCGSPDDVLLTTLFAVHRPLEGWGYRSFDLEQEAERLGVELPQQPTKEHHALNDAMHNLVSYEFLTQLEQERARDAA